jgi:hypothetical protein
VDSIVSYGQKLVDAGLPENGAKLSEVTDGVEIPGIYPRSLTLVEGAALFLAREGAIKVLAVLGNESVLSRFEGEEVRVEGLTVKVVKRTPAAAVTLRELLPYTAPVGLKDRRTTFGTGDRLGEATPAHARSVGSFEATPVLAQQSVRELTLTGRDYPTVMDDVTWGVFQEGYRGGYGADGDHLKDAAQIADALAAGVTMITADVSEEIHPEVSELNEAELADRYRELDPAIRKLYEEQYLGRKVEVTDNQGLVHGIEFDEVSLARAVLTFGDAVDYAVGLYQDLLADNGVDFEMSIDETAAPTDPAAHYLVARELWGAGVELYSLAPRFTGEFQKGIDYIGDVNRFETEFRAHAAIADSLGHKLSIHSGSDKFAIFPVIGRYTGFRFHHKTAGTSWLEAMKLVAQKNPALYRAMHAAALETYDYNRRLYHITADPEQIADLRELSDEQLVSLFENDHQRQVIHIAYGTLLLEGPDGPSEFREDFFELLRTDEAEHYNLVARHMDKHLTTLGVPRVEQS